MVVVFDEAELEAAVEIQARCYALLIWVEDAISRGYHPIERVARVGFEPTVSSS